MLPRPVLLGALLVACSPASPTPAATPTAITPAAPASDTPVAASPVTPTATEPTIVPPTAAPDTPATPDVPAAPDAADAADAPVAALPSAPPGSRFQLAAYRDSGWLDLHRLGDEIFVSGSGGLAHEGPGGRLVAVEYGLSGQQPSPWGMFDAWNTEALGGQWPDNAWLVTHYDASRDSSPPLVHRREGNTWKLQDTKQDLLYLSYAPIVTWHSGQVLGLRSYTIDPDIYSDNWDGDIPKRISRKIDRQMKAARRGFDLLGATRSETAMVLDEQAVEVAAVAAAASGELFLLASGGSPSRSVVQRWSRDGAALGVDRLPGDVRGNSLAVRAADEVYVGGVRDQKPVLLRFDGAAWSEEPVPQGGAMISVAVAPEGELWAIVTALTPTEEQGELRHDLWRRSARGAAWEQAELPELRYPDRAHPEWAYDMDRAEYVLHPPDPAAAERSWRVDPRQVLARGPDDVWVVGDTELQREGLGSYMTGRAVVLRSRKVAAPLRMLASGDLLLERLDWSPAPPWTAAKGCGDDDLPFVAVRTVPRDTPRNHPEPAVEAFVRDNQPLLASVEQIGEYMRRGRRTIGMFVRPADQAGADALLAALERVAPGEKRALECRRPRIRRSFDKQTGRANEAPVL